MKLIRNADTHRIQGEDQYTDEYLARLARSAAKDVAAALGSTRYNVISAEYEVSRSSPRSRYLWVIFTVEGYVFSDDYSKCSPEARISLYQPRGGTFKDKDRWNDEVQRVLRSAIPENQVNELILAYENSIATLEEEIPQIGLEYGLELKTRIGEWPNKSEILPRQLSVDVSIYDVLDLPDNVHVYRPYEGAYPDLQNDSGKTVDVPYFHAKNPVRTDMYDTTECLQSVRKSCEQIRGVIEDFCTGPQLDVDAFLEEVDSYLNTEYKLEADDSGRYSTVSSKNSFLFTLRDSNNWVVVSTEADIRDVTPKQVAGRLKSQLTRLANKNKPVNRYRYEREI